MSSIPCPTPTVTPETAPFWRAAAEGRLVLQSCDSCGTVIWYPRSVCPMCSSRSLVWQEATGVGRIYSFTIVHRGQGEYGESNPYVLAFVELDEGPRIITNILDAELDDLEIGARVEAMFQVVSGECGLVRFRLAPKDDNKVGN